MIAKLLLLLLFFGSMIAIGLYCRKHTVDVNGFVLGGRNVGPWLTAFAYGTSYFSAVIFIGYAGQFGWKYGIASTWIGIGNAVVGTLMAWDILGRRTRVMTQHLNSATMPEFFGKRFGSKPLTVGASLIVFIFLIPYTASLYNGLSRLFSMAFPSIGYEQFIVVMAVLTGIYVIAGGYMATAINDFIQGLIMLGGITAVVAAVLRMNGGFLGALARLAQVADTAPADPLAGTPGVFASFFGPDPVNLFFVVVLTSLGTWGLPQMVQKFYAIKSETQIRKGGLISTFFALVVAGGCYFLGGFGRLFDGKIDIAAEGYDSVIPAMIKGMPDLLIAFVVILVLSASMSTLSSLVIASSSTLTIDVIKGSVVKDMSEKRQVFWMRVLIVVFIAISAVIAVAQYKQGLLPKEQRNENLVLIAQLMGVSWGALSGSFLAPFLYGLYWRKVTKPAVWTCFVFGSGIMLLNLFCRGSFPEILRSPINCGAFAMLAGLVIVPVVSWLTPKPDPRKVDAIFSCYNATTSVPVSKDLGD